ncbi:autotransporter outer membrane beta-barrel domain-containing protein [Paenochrobactrum glaciei]|uniref:Autotransporter domain-containing protein n=1 Tax=Paenochrobactrum glaciei TaxID=486407 RepID=A0ABP3RKD1_9HYPH
MLASAGLALISLSHVSSVQANEWTGAVSNDFFDPRNWSDGQGPQGNNSVVNFGKPVGVSDANNGGHDLELIDQVGVVAGADADVTIHFIPEHDNWREVGVGIGDNTVIGKAGGKGKLNIVFDEIALSRVDVETLTVGDGQGSNGEFNIIGTGKDAGQLPPEGPVYISEGAHVEPAFLLSIYDMAIGKNGGTGVVNVQGSILGFENRDNITIGQGAGSHGTVNVLSGGKFTDGTVWTDEDSTKLIVGTGGGTGVFNVVGSGSANRGDAPLATLANGLTLGNDAGTGIVNVLGGGKVHSYVNSRVLSWGEDPTDPATDWSDYYTKLGINGGTGEINVSGKGSVWYQSGITLQDLFRNIDENGQEIPDWKPGNLSDDYEDIDTLSANLYVGESGHGALNIADDGVVRIGTATFRYSEPRVNDEYVFAYALQDHKADGSLVLAKEAGGAGTLNIGGKEGAAATTAGRLMAKDIVFGEGTGLVRFNHTNTDYVFDKFDAKFMDGPSRAQTLQLKGKGTIEAISGRTIFEEDQLEFTGNINIKNVGILQINKDISGADVKLTGGMLEGVGTVGNVENRGIIAPGKAFGNSEASIGTLTVKGNYTGNGGGVLIDAVLGDDTSKADRLIITGNTSGNSTVAVRNIGGKGADTVEGIKIIQVDGQSDGEFKLIGNYTRRSVGVVVAGAHTYKLHQGSVSEPTNGHWYLRSETEDEGYQAGIPVYEAYPQFLLGLNNLPTMQQRVGNRYWKNAGNMVIAQGADAVEAYAPAREAGSLTQTNGVWGRIEGAHTKMEPNTSTTDADYDFNAYKMQAGLDGMVYENEQGKLIAGGTVHYTHGLASIWSPYDADLGRGRIKTDGYGFGATLTWAGDDGFYVDNQAQLTWYRSDLSYAGGKSELKDGKNNGFGYALSSEVGKRFTLDQHWSLTPQAQLQYSNVDFSDFTDVFGADVSRKKGDSLRARLGLSVDYQNSWQNAQGMTDRSSVYGIVNLYNEFLSGTKVRVSTEDFINKSERFWGGIGFGGSYNWDDDKYSIYGEGSVNTSFKNFGDSYNYQGTLGVRVKW